MRPWSSRTRSGLSLILTLLAAWVLRWDAGDLMWGAWASSLTFGWAYGVVLMTANPKEVDGGGGRENLGRLLLMVGFFSVHFLLFHYYQGLILTMFFPVSPDTGSLQDTLLYPLPVLRLYWLVVAATFFARFEELREATKPSADTLRMLRPYGNVVRIQLLVFLFLVLGSMNLIRFAVYPALILYFFPIPRLTQTLKSGFDRLSSFMNTRGLG
jgi:hypothetical protein